MRAASGYWPPRFPCTPPAHKVRRSRSSAYCHSGLASEVLEGGAVGAEVGNAHYRMSVRSNAEPGRYRCAPPVGHGHAGLHAAASRLADAYSGCWSGRSGWGSSTQTRPTAVSAMSTPVIRPPIADSPHRSSTAGDPMALSGVRSISSRAFRASVRVPPMSPLVDHQRRRDAPEGDPTVSSDGVGHVREQIHL